MTEPKNGGTGNVLTPQTWVLLSVPKEQIIESEFFRYNTKRHLKKSQEKIAYNITENFRKNLQFRYSTRVRHQDFVHKCSKTESHVVCDVS